MRNRQRAQRSRDQDRDRDRDQRGKGTVVSCRLDHESLEALDTLVEAGVRTTRADAAAWLIQIGIQTKQQLLTDLVSTVAEIRRLREDAANKARANNGPNDSSTDSDTTRSADSGGSTAD